jgi:hypothetical protein
MNDTEFQQLKIIQVDYHNVWTYCPFHKDSIRPNLSISTTDSYYGRYKCWACGAEGRLTEKQISKLLINNPPTQYINRKQLSTCWKEFVSSCHNNIQKFPLLKIELAQQLNVSCKSLDDWGVGYDGISFTIPMCRPDLPQYYRDEGICGVQRRFSDGSKRSVLNSRLGYMYADIDMLYELVCDAGCLFICEGFSDGIAVWDLGFPSISRPNCHYIESIISVLYEITEVEDGLGRFVIIPDNDTVGIEGASKLRNKIYYETENTTIHSFTTGAKDIREYIMKYGKDKVRQELGRYI